MPGSIKSRNNNLISGFLCQPIVDDIVDRYSLFDREKDPLLNVIYIKKTQN
jgi:hypothetical protein